MVVWDFCFINSSAASFHHPTGPPPGMACGALVDTLQPETKNPAMAWGFPQKLNEWIPSPKLTDIAPENRKGAPKGNDVSLENHPFSVLKTIHFQVRTVSFRVSPESQLFQGPSFWGPPAVSFRGCISIARAMVLENSWQDPKIFLFGRKLEKLFSSSWKEKR